jgi:hypothetical protein
VVVLATSVTTTTRVFAMLANATVTNLSGSPLLAVLLETGRLKHR